VISKPLSNMKKSNIHSFFVGLLILASMASFTYINTVNVKAHNKNAVKELKEEATEKVDRMTLPDVRIVKKILDKSVTLLPK